MVRNAQCKESLAVLTTLDPTGNLNLVPDDRLDPRMFKVYAPDLIKYIIDHNNSATNWIISPWIAGTLALLSGLS